MKKVFIVRLTEAERAELDALVRKGKTSALAIARARILLKADQGENGEAWTDAQVAEALTRIIHVSVRNYRDLARIIHEIDG